MPMRAVLVSQVKRAASGSPGNHFDRPSFLSSAQGSELFGSFALTAFSLKGKDLELRKQVYSSFADAKETTFCTPRKEVALQTRLDSASPSRVVKGDIKAHLKEMKSHIDVLNEQFEKRHGHLF